MSKIQGRVIQESLGMSSFLLISWTSGAYTSNLFNNYLVILFGSNIVLLYEAKYLTQLKFQIVKQIGCIDAPLRKLCASKAVLIKTKIHFALNELYKYLILLLTFGAFACTNQQVFDRDIEISSNFPRIFSSHAIIAFVIFWGKMTCDFLVLTYYRMHAWWVA